MDFDAILEQVLALVQRQGRVSYRAIQRRFAVDDHDLAALKEEILFAYRHIVDEEGRGLVWTEASTPTVGSPSQLPAPGGAPVQAASVASHTPEAERRQLTVMFCDLADSTRLAGQLDPEDFRYVIRAYQHVSTAVIQSFDGHIAQYLGDGLLVYFGWPQAHEDDAQRSVRTGLRIIEAMGPLNTRLEREHGVRLAVRIGIHTGPVVVGTMGSGSHHEQLALGETPNIAARLEGLAASNTVVISEFTRRLVGGVFELEGVGVHALKGVTTSMQVYRVRGESTIESRFEAATAIGLTPLVGREEEIGLVLRRWEQAKEGEGQVLLLCGEPGIGKSRLTQSVRERMAADLHVWVRYQCSPYATNSAFAPIMAQVERMAQFARRDTSVQKLAKLEAWLAQAMDAVTEVAPLFAALLSIPSGERYAPLTLSSQRQKERTIEAVVAHCVGLAKRAPVLLIFEDAHWSDPTSLEVLELLIHRITAVRMLAVITYRPEFEPPWRHYAHVTTHTLNRLTRPQVAALVTGVTGGKALPAEVLDQIVAKTDGVPLFVEELTKTVLESDLLIDQGDHYGLTGPLPPLGIPATLHDSLMARLDRLGPVKEVAQMGAVIGREFPYEVVAALSPLQDEALHAALGQLVDTGLLFRRGTPPEATYLFKHALVQDAAYASLLKSTRQHLHTRIATVLEVQFPATIATAPEVVARHYTAAGLPQRALPYWQQAGVRAAHRSAYAEAIGHLTTGLAVLQTLPDTPERDQHELALHIALGGVLIGAKSYSAPEVEHSFARARALCQQLRETPEFFHILYGLWAHYYVGGQLQTARELAEQCLHLAQRANDPALFVGAHQALGATCESLGQFVDAHAHLEQGIALYDSKQHRALGALYGHDIGVACLVHAALTLWMLGYPDQALVRSHEALTLAGELSHPFSRGLALAFALWLHHCRREVQAVQERAEAALTLSVAQGFPHWEAFGSLFGGWALAEQGHGAAGLAQIHQGLAGMRATDTGLSWPSWLTVLIEVYSAVGQAEEGLTVLADALHRVETTGERFWEAELHRLKGALLLKQSPPDAGQAARCFHHALDVARHQQAKSLELRAAMSLSRLWQSQDKRQEALDLLASVYGWFTEGFDTVDLQDAKLLLEDLSS